MAARSLAAAFPGARGFSKLVPGMGYCGQPFWQAYRAKAAKRLRRCTAFLTNTDILMSAHRKISKNNPRVSTRDRTPLIRTRFNASSETVALQALLLRTEISNKRA